MKKIFLATFLLVVPLLALGSGQALTIEDRTLISLDVNTTKIIKFDKSFNTFGDLKCQLISEQIPGTLSSKSTLYFITTKDACGWGAALGPIWLVKVDSSESAIVLYTGGYSLELLTTSHKEMYDVKIEDGRASHIYIYNGHSYLKR